MISDPSGNTGDHKKLGMELFRVQHHVVDSQRCGCKFGLLRKHSDMIARDLSR
jgi:hypothetical protein